MCTALSARRRQTDCGAIFDDAGLLDLGAAINGPDGFAAVEAFERSMFSGDTDPALWDFVVSEIRATPAYAGVPLLFDHCAQDWRDVLTRIDIATLVLGCDGSHVSPDSQRYIAERIPNAELHVFPTTEASSHFVFLENPLASTRWSTSSSPEAPGETAMTGAPLLTARPEAIGAPIRMVPAQC